MRSNTSQKSKTYVNRMLNGDEQLPGNSQNAIECEGRISFESLFSSPWICERGWGYFLKKKWSSSFSSIKVLIITAQKCSTGGPKIESKSRPEEDGPLPSPVGLRWARYLLPEEERDLPHIHLYLFEHLYQPVPRLEWICWSFHHFKIRILTKKKES